MPLPYDFNTDSHSSEYIFDDQVRVVVMLESRDGSRRFLAFPNLIGPVNVRQDTEYIRDWEGQLVRQLQTGPVEISIPQHGTWYHYDPAQGDPAPDFSPTKPALPTLDKQVEQ